MIDRIPWNKTGENAIFSTGGVYFRVEIHFPKSLEIRRYSSPSHYQMGSGKVVYRREWDEKPMTSRKQGQDLARKWLQHQGVIAPARKQEKRA